MKTFFDRLRISSYLAVNWYLPSNFGDSVGGLEYIAPAYVIFFRDSYFISIAVRFIEEKV